MESCREGKGPRKARECSHRNALSGLHGFEVLPLGTQNCVKLIQLIVSFPVLQSLTKLFSLSGKPPVKC